MFEEDLTDKIAICFIFHIGNNICYKYAEKFVTDEVLTRSSFSYGK